MTSGGVSSGAPPALCGQRNDCFPDDFDLTFLVCGGHPQPHPLFAITLEFLGHGSLTGQAITNMSDGNKPRFELAQSLLCRPFSQHPAQIRHREHPVSKHIIHTGFAGEVQVNMNGIMISRGAGKQGESYA